MVDNQVCGRVQNGTKNGQWYTVRCSKPLKGSTLKLVTTRNEYLSISGIQAYSAMARSGRTTRTRRSRGGFGMRGGGAFKMSFTMGG
jgi:hypothetical protein